MVGQFLSALISFASLILLVYWGLRTRLLLGRREQQVREVLRRDARRFGRVLAVLGVPRS